VGAESSVVGRVARSAALFASASALVAASLASVLGAYLLQRAEDRRLRESAFVLANELGAEPLSAGQIEVVVQDELEETRHAGTRFAVLGAQGAFVAGDAPLARPAIDACVTDEAAHQRACTIAGGGGRAVVAASAHTPETLPFLLAACVAVAFAGVATWLGSRPVARAAVAPLSRLRARLAALDAGSVAQAELGPDEQVLEVDELRATIAQLIARIGAALEQAQRFSANAAHELRTPLTAVRAELELLAERPALPADMHAPLGALRGKVSELARLVERLLILATPKRTREEPNEIISLRDVLEDVARALPADEQRRLNSCEHDALVRGDSVLLTTLFANGLGNALKFGHEVRVALSSSDQEAVVEIDDDGPGVASDARERVFEPFYREPLYCRPAGASRVPGHGLGLALIRHVAESHGGSARFVDKASPGARLQIRLPRVEG